MSEIKPELVERMVKLVQRVSGQPIFGFDTSPWEWAREAKAIAAELPVPVDPDLIEARETAVPYTDGLTRDILEGGYDSHSSVCAALAGIKRGRELATPSPEIERLGGVGV